MNNLLPQKIKVSLKQNDIPGSITSYKKYVYSPFQIESIFAVLYSFIVLIDAKFVILCFNVLIQINPNTVPRNILGHAMKFAPWQIP